MLRIRGKLWPATLLLLLLALTLSHRPAAAADAVEADAAQQEQEPPPALPEADDSDPATPKLSLGEKIKLDHLGPAIITEEGYVRRITNWEEMTEAERDVARKRIAERNKERVEQIKKLAMEAKAQKKGDSGDSNGAGDGSETGKAKAGKAAQKKEEELDEVDQKYKDVVDFKRMSQPERARYIKSQGEEGKKKLAMRVAEYHKERTAKMSEDEKEEMRKTGEEVLDSAMPRFRTKLVRLLEEAKKGRGGSREDVQRALERMMNDKVKRAQDFHNDAKAKLKKAAGKVLGSDQTDSSKASGSKASDPSLDYVEYDTHYSDGDDEYFAELEELEREAEERERLLEAEPPSGAHEEL